MSINAALMSSAHQAWVTPNAIIKNIIKIAPIGLDPCGNVMNSTGAVMCWHDNDAKTTERERKQDGLKSDWRGYGLVYMNPPYGRDVAKWTAKARSEAKRGASIIALLPARTDTVWFQRDVSTANAIVFMKGRLKFQKLFSDWRIGESLYPAPFPSIIAMWGSPDEVEKFIRVFRKKGFVSTRESDFEDRKPS